jgi:hypothetical protein
LSNDVINSILECSDVRMQHIANIKCKNFIAAVILKQK